MAGRMSNRDRIAHLRAEADATAKEKDAARAEKAAKPPAARKSAKKAAPKPKGRVRIVWNVCDQSGKPVMQFPYAQEKEAIAEAADRTTKSGRTHFVSKADIAVE